MGDGMQESRAIALWSVLLGGGFIGGIWLWHDPPEFLVGRPIVPMSTPAAPFPSPTPVQPVPVPQAPPPAAERLPQPRLDEQAIGTVPVVEPPAPPPPPAPPAPPPRKASASPEAAVPAEPRVPPPVTATAARPAPDFPTIPPGPRSGDNAEARRYTDALNALSTEGYSGVDRIVPDGDQFRATAIMEGQRFEVLVNPDTGQVLRLSRPR